MATFVFTAKDAVLTGTATVTCYYTITETDDTLTFTADSITVKVDSYRAWHNAFPDCGLSSSIWTGSKATIAANGSKSWTINRSVTTSKTHSNQSASVYFGFYGQEAGDDYPSGSSDQLTYIIPAKTSYSITLYANGGSGGTTSLTKWHGEPLDLTTDFTAPTRVGYRFEGWALSGDTVIDEYDVDEATTLYAVWTPVITGVSLDVRTLRVDSTTSTSESDDGDHCYGTVAYTVTGNAAGTLTLSISADNSAVVFDSGQNVELTKNADTALTGTHVFRASNCDTDTKITFAVFGSATNTSVSGEAPVTVSQSDVLSVAYFPLDILGDNYASQGQRPGHGLAIGLPAKKEGFAVGMDIFFQQWAGVIQMFAGSTPPAGWLLCDGSAVSREDYAVLYAAIGDTWGAGDGSTTFNLPDLRGRTAVGVDPDGSMDSYTESANMLLTDTAGIAQEAYLTHKLKLTGKTLEANTRYTLQLFDVHICHSGKTETTIGLQVFWGAGGSVNVLSDFVAADPNNDGETTLKSYTSNGNVYAYCRHLTITLDTTGKSQGDNQLWIYNSIPEASGTRLVEIGRWMLTKESDGALPWEPRRFFHRFGAFDLGGTGGIDHPDFRTEHMPSHTHDKGSLSIAASGSHSHRVKGYGNHVAKGSNYYRYGSSGGETVSIGMTSETHAHPNGYFSGNTGSAGDNHSFDVRQSYAAVNYIIHTGKTS